MGLVADNAVSLLAGQDPALSSRLVAGRFCEHPIRLLGYGTNQATGEHTHKTKFVPCKSRRRAKCLACSDVYARDAYTVVSSGWRDGTPFLWLTLTAPSFGCQHHHWAGKNGKSRCTPKRRCPGCGKAVPACRQFHKSGDPLIGVPVCDCFDYEGAAAFNAAVPALWTATTKALASAFLADGGRLQYIKVVEWQRRGLVHIHALIRGVDDATEARRVIEGVEVGGFKWGNAHAELLHRQTTKSTRRRFSYIVKYATKNVADHHVEKSRSLSAHYDRLRTVAVESCEASIEFDAASEEFSLTPGRGPRVASAHSSGLGYGGHTLTKSQNWGESFLSIRARRHDWAAENHPADSWEWIWHREGNGYDWANDEMQIAADAVHDELRRRCNAPPRWRTRFVFLGSIEDEDGTQRFTRDPHGRVVTSTSLMLSAFQKLG